MAAGRHNLTRRALLGAAFAAPVALGDNADQTGADGRGATMARRWDRAFAALERARAAEHAFRNGPMAAAERAFRAIRERWPFTYNFEAAPEARATVRAAFNAFNPWEKRLNELEVAHQRAIQRLLLARAPDPPALAMNIELAVDWEVWECEDGDRYMAALKADALNLARASAD